MAYQLSTILWIEDQWEVLVDYAYLIACNDKITKAYGLGSPVSIIISGIEKKVAKKRAETEIERIVQEAGDNGTIINVRTAQIARTYLENNIPGAIICDSNFPLNGAAVVKWLEKHGLSG